MKFFTPELLQQFNSPDPERADEAGEALEGAIVDYRRRLKEVRAGLPRSVRHYLAKYGLHDAEVLGLAESPAPRFTSSFSVARLFVRQDDRSLILEYLLAEKPDLKRTALPDSMSSEQARWLYDEIDIIDDRVFSHEIFLSNGSLIKLSFLGFKVVKGALPPMARIAERTAPSPTERR